eukprot:1139334-Pelagomonas_calceolata.AAC.14
MHLTTHTTPTHPGAACSQTGVSSKARTGWQEQGKKWAAAAGQELSGKSKRELKHAVLTGLTGEEEHP